MLEHFEGSKGRHNLVEAFAKQELVDRNDTIASKLAHVAALEALDEGKSLYVAGDPGRGALFFLLHGSLDLLFQGQRVARLQPGQCVGEFPILEHSVNYTVTAVAREQSVVASVSEENFRSIASEHPELWKNMAKMLAWRLFRANEANLKSS